MTDEELIAKADEDLELGGHDPHAQLAALIVIGRSLIRIADALEATTP
jgi:hypothetical protein